MRPRKQHRFQRVLVGAHPITHWPGLRQHPDELRLGPQAKCGVALYVPASGFYWMSSIGGQLAGGCY